MHHWLKKILLLSMVLICLPAFVLAEDLELTCKQISDSTNSCQNISSADCRSLLEKCATYYDNQSAAIAKDITKTKQQKNTLQSQISSLKKKIKGLEYDISQGKIMVKDLNLQINDTQVSIDKTAGAIQDSQNQITQILRSIYQEDQKPSFVILLEGNLTDFFGNITHLESLNSKISDLLESSTNLKSYLETQRGKQENEKGQLQKTIQVQSLQEKQHQQSQKQQEQYLKLTEAQYQQQLKDKQDAEKKATKIKAQLFQIAGVSKLPTFGEALEVAKAVSVIIPIRPAFLLAVISQESAIGKNVGKCLLVDSTTGVGKRISTGATIPKLLKPTRDLQPFLKIMSSLGRDPYNSILSCPITSGYDGGSMGPAQFLPSTWNLFVARLQTLLGVAADPWAIKDSFAASALYLSDLGAGAKTKSAEQNAAYSYNGSGSMARIYSRSVMTRASCIQGFMDNGTMSADCQNLIF